MKMSGSVEWKVELSGRCEKFRHSCNGGVESIQLTFVDLVPINVSGIKLPKYQSDLLARNYASLRVNSKSSDQPINTMCCGQHPFFIDQRSPA